MEELFPERIRTLRNDAFLFRELKDQCIRDLHRTGFEISLDAIDWMSLHEELTVFTTSLSEMERARLSYIVDIPDSILRAVEQSGSTGQTFAEAFLRREALKVITRIQYSGTDKR